jgi:hypothetical protein
VTGAHRWAVITLVSSIVALAAADVASGTALTTVPLVWFLAVVPGMPYARLVTPPERDWVQRWVTAVGLSIALAAVVAEVLLYTDTYSGFTAVALLGGIAVAGALVEQWRSARNAADAPEQVTAATE